VSNIYAVNADGTDLQQLKFDGASSFPEWDGSQIRYRGAPPVDPGAQPTSTPGVATVAVPDLWFWTMNADGSNSRPLLDLNGLLGKLSPPGQPEILEVPGDPGRDSVGWQPTP
jgi:hypothetical protein